MFPEPWQLALAFLAAFFAGMAKTGIAGLGILVAAIFALLMPAKQSSGFVLPLLILGDFVAVYHYRSHANWKQALKPFPWTIPGILLGFATFGHIDNEQARLLIGAIVALMVVWHLVRKFTKKATAGVPVESSPSLKAQLSVAALGIAAGFTTLIANAAGPIMTLYLLALRMPKLEFVGTAAVFFCGLNLLKVPFMVGLGSITLESLQWNLLLAPAVLAGTWLGRLTLLRIPQKWFEYCALLLSAAAAARMLLH